jgi:HlyD family secretion protein
MSRALTELGIRNSLHELVLSRGTPPPQRLRAGAGNSFEAQHRRGGKPMDRASVRQVALVRPVHSLEVVSAIDTLAASPSVSSKTASVATAPAHSKRLRIRVARWTIVALAAAATAGGVIRYRSTQRTEPLHFETAKVDRGRIAAKVSATGTLSALVTVNVGSQVSGRVEKLLVDFGSQVRKGQTVATLDPSFFRAAVTQARANYLAAKAAVEKTASQEVLARRQHARAKLLADEGLASRADLEAAEAELEASSATRSAAEAGVTQAKAALEQAELNLRYTTIVSPIDGVVISRNVDVGQTVAAALQAPTLLLVAQDLTHMEVDTNVAEADVGKIKSKMDVTFTVDAYPDHTFHGIVRQVRDNAQTIQNVVTYDAVIDVDNPDRLLKPGMTASVTFVHAVREGALRLSNAALRFKPDAATLALLTPHASGPNDVLSTPEAPRDQRTVWVVRSGTASLVNIRVGVSDGSSTEVTGGDLHEGDEALIEASPSGAAKRTP